MKRGISILRRAPGLLLLLTLFCLAFGQMAHTFNVGAVAVDACEQSCPGEDSGDHCDPGCDLCACCSFAPQGLTRTPVSTPMSSTYSLHAPDPAVPLPPEPAGILHVPKHLLS